MKTILDNIQQKLQNIPALKYIDENWGQLNDYTPHPPTLFPLALIDINTIDYSNIGSQRTGLPIPKQMATASMIITIANQKLTNTNAKAPQAQKDKAWEIWNVVELVHQNLQGFTPNEYAGALIRTGLRKIKLDAGMQIYEISYTFSLNNV